MSCCISNSSDLKSNLDQSLLVEIRARVFVLPILWTKNFDVARLHEIIHIARLSSRYVLAYVCSLVRASPSGTERVNRVFLTLQAVDSPRGPNEPRVVPRGRFFPAARLVLRLDSFSVKTAGADSGFGVFACNDLRSIAQAWPRESM